MNELTRRVEALESKAPPAQLVVVRVIVEPGRLDAPLVRAEIDAGTLLRAADETQADFLARVEAHALRRRSLGASAVRVTAYSD